MVSKMNTKLKKIGLLASVGLLAAASAQTAYADLGELTSTPLFISNAVEPNIFMTLDDSGNMDWEVMYPEGTEFYFSSGGTPYVDGRRRLYSVGSASSVFAQPDQHAETGTVDVVGRSEVDRY